MFHMMIEIKTLKGGLKNVYSLEGTTLKNLTSPTYTAAFPYYFFGEPQGYFWTLLGFSPDFGDFH